MHPYREVPTRTPEGKPRRTSALRLLRWWLAGGSKRLRAARLRRAGRHLEALAMFISSTDLIDLIKTFPKVWQRELVYRHLARMMTSPCKPDVVRVNGKEL